MDHFIPLTIFMKILHKIGYLKNSKLTKNNLRFEMLLIKSFQRHFRQEAINGKIDQECLLIAKKIYKSYK